MCDNHVNEEEFGNWNPMKDDFYSSRFNKYDSGPGAELDDKLQPANEVHFKQKEYISPKEINEAPFLVIKKAPPNITKNSLRNFCSRHGTVLSINYAPQCKFYFVVLSSVADMERVIKALKKSTYGFFVEVGQKNLKPRSKKIEDQPYYNRLNAQRPKDSINLSQRKLELPKKFPPRIQISQKPLVEIAAYESIDSLLQKNDPNRMYLLVDDMHFGERTKIIQPLLLDEENSKSIIYNNGAAYFDVPEEIKNSLNEQREKTFGLYDAESDTFRFSTNLKYDLEYDRCRVCKLPCDTECQRCSSPFCSSTCQLQSVANHGAECAYDFNQSTASLSPENALPRDNMPCSGDLVAITAVTRSNLIFIRSLKPESDRKYFKIITKIQDAAEARKPLCGVPQCGQIVLTNFTKDLYSRAMLLNVDKHNEILLIHIDYGNIENKKLSELYEASNDVLMLPCCAMAVCLKNVPVFYMTDIVRTFMYSHLSKSKMRIEYNVEEDQLPNKLFEVELFNESNNRNFNEHVVYLYKPLEPTNTDPLNMDYLRNHPLPVQENTELLIMDNTALSYGLISCTTLAGFHEINLFCREIQLYAENTTTTAYAPRQKELCLAKYVDGKWYRGVCLEIVGDGFPTILFLDYGNMQATHVSSIRQYPAEFRFPIVTFDCYIEGIPETPSEDLLNELNQILTIGKTINCELKTPPDNNPNYYKMIMPDLLQALNEKNLLTPEEDFVAKTD